MKKLIFGVISLAAFIFNSFGESGGVWMGNLNNPDTSPTATWNGKYFIYTQIGAVLLPAQYASMNITLWCGPDADDLSFVGTINDGTYIHAGWEGYGDGPSYLGNCFDTEGREFHVTVPSIGVPVLLKQQVWLGSDPDWSSAVAHNAYRAEISWMDSVNDEAGAPQFDNMPATILAQDPVPEPGTLALTALGTAALLAWRRRK